MVWFIRNILVLNYSSLIRNWDSVLLDDHQAKKNITTKILQNPINETVLWGENPDWHCESVVTIVWLDIFQCIIQIKHCMNVHSCTSPPDLLQKCTKETFCLLHAALQAAQPRSWKLNGTVWVLGWWESSPLRSCIPQPEQEEPILSSTGFLREYKSTGQTWIAECCSIQASRLWALLFAPESRSRVQRSRKPDGTATNTLWFQWKTQQQPHKDFRFGSIELGMLWKQHIEKMPH